MSLQTQVARSQVAKDGVGVTKDDQGEVRFEDHGRYASLMANSPSLPDAADANKYPQLVSFIGVTSKAIRPHSTDTD